MKRLLNFFCFFCSFYLCLAALSASAMAAPPIPGFNASYTVSAKGVEVGTGTLVLSWQNNRYTIKLDAAPSGIASLVSSDTIHEQSIGVVQKDMIKPDRYQYVRQKRKEEENVVIDFLWKENQLKVKENGKINQVKMSDNLLDPLSLQLRVMLDLKAGKQNSQYALYDDGEIKTYNIRFTGEETIATSQGEIKVLKAVQRRAKSSRETTFWFAPSKNYLPVQILQTKNGKEIFKMVLKQKSGN